MTQGVKLPELENSIKAWLGEVETLKRNHPALLADKKKNQEDITEFILGLFFKCDNEEREATFDRGTVTNF